MRFIAEWEPQAAILFTWPHHASSWAPTLEAIEPVYAQMVQEIQATQPVIILCHDESVRARAMKLLGDNLSRVQLLIVPTNDTWIRDYGPISVQHAETNTQAVLSFTFNAWGNKYPAAFDNQATAGLFNQLQKNLVAKHPLVLEGGSLETDGLGTLLTTKQCLLNPSRNPSLNQRQIEETLSATLGIKRFLWLTHGHLEGDDTDSHIDMLARFVSPTQICYTCCDDPTDTHFASHQAMKQELEAFKTSEGKPYELTALPWPSAKYNHEGDRMAASYANFLITNELVLVPTYQDPKDKIALEKIQALFPSRKVIGIMSLPLIQQCGSIHCASMQIAQGIL